MGTAAADWMGMSATPGNDDRFRLLYETHVDDLGAYCRRRLGADEAEDALADVFAVAWRRREDVPLGHEARLWLYGVARNVVRNSQRKARRRRRLNARLIGSSDPPESGPAETLITMSEHEDVLVALVGLKPSDQELLRLRAWEELSRDDIARVLGISVAAVDMRLHRAIARMSRALKSDAGEISRDSTRRADERGGES